VGVAIDETGRDPAARHVDRLGGLQCRHLGRRPDPGDAALARGNGGWLDDAKARARRIERGDACIRPKSIDLHGASLWRPLTTGLRRCRP
jgi:hypothetical protein